VNRIDGRLRVEALVKALRADRVSSAFDEGATLREFVGPLFVALGWDVHNEARRVGRDVEVLAENEPRARGRRPAYAFRVAGEPKFFVEAERSSHSVGDIEDIFRVKSCAWSAGAPLALLFSKAGMRAFNGALRPDRKKPQKGRLPALDHSMEEILDRFYELHDVLSREAVAAGSLDRILARERRARCPVDRDFFNGMQRWRAELSAELARRNRFDAPEALGEATQRILDRILFLRVCEDRGIQPCDGLLTALLSSPTTRRGALYPALVKVFRRAEIHFNGALFEPHFSEELRIERDEILRSIVSSLHDPSPYRFDVIPVELLGSVYERLLGSAITLKNGRPSVELRPEVRRAGGVYYTPRFIVNAIIDRTLGPFTRGKTPEELCALRVIDPACGSGTFLLAAFDHIVEAHERFYNQSTPCPDRYKGDFVLRSGVPRLTLRKKEEILASCIHGVDVDEQAVEIARMSLYLKLLEGERDVPIGRRPPPLLLNVRRGDSLLEQSLAPEVDGGGANALSGTFHAVIGNPPYLRIQEMSAPGPHAVALYKSRYRAARKGNFDAYALFVERALELIRPDGLVGFILPHKFFQAKYGAALRALLAERGAVHEIVDFGDAQVFEGATTYTCLFYLGGSPAKEVLLRRVNAGVALPRALATALSRPANVIPTSELARPTWSFRAGGGELADRLRAANPPLGEVCKRIFQGLVTGADDVFFLEARGNRLYSRALKSEVDVEPALLLPLLKGSAHIRRYAFDPTPLRALFPYGSPQSELLSKDELRRSYPKAWGYFLACKEALEARERGKWKGNECWYAYGRSQALALVGRPKILCPSLAKRSSFAVDPSGEMSFSGSGGGGGGGYGLLVRPDVSMDYICALLNSRLLEWLLRSQTTPFRGGYIASNRQYIEGLPIRLPRLDLPNEKAEHDALAELSRRIAALARERRGGRAPEVEAAILEADRAIDDRVYHLYGLSPAERGLVERAIPT
jgi:hypothetical protein